MGIFDNFQDTPDQIKKEGQEITVTFKDNGDGTGKICWNIPAPAIGCDAESQAYNGIVLTVSDSPANYTTTSPVDGTFYNADPTADPDMHAGDKLDGARVVGALYNDKETTCVTISDVKDRTAYYVSAYAVDSVGRYHKQGVHAYSLPSGAEEPNGSESTPAFNDIAIDTTTGINADTLTGLDRTRTYDLELQVNHECFTLEILGVNALTYRDLVDEINKKLAELSTDLFGPHFPNENQYYVDILNEKLFFWDGETNTEVDDVVFLETDPTVPILGTYWYNPETEIMNLYESSGWVPQTNVIRFMSDPTQPSCDDLWFDGLDIWQWDGTHWCKLNAIIQTRNPLLGPDFTCSVYWFNTETGELFEWEKEFNKWDDTVAIYYPSDPNDINTGDFWFDETEELVRIFIGGMWNELNNIRYEERDETTGDLPDPLANHYWYVPSEQTLFKRNVSNTSWVEQEIALSPTDPLDRESCNLWWNSSPSIDELFVWDEVNTQWLNVSQFFQTDIDPSLPSELPDNSAWYNPDTNEIQLILGKNCLPVPFVFSSNDPTNPITNTLWFDTVNSIWFVWDGTAWVEINPIILNRDPFVVDIGEFWFDTVNNTLNQWDGTAWVDVPYSDSPLTPEVGTLWFDTVECKLYEWNGSEWVDGRAIARAELFLGKNSCGEGKDRICFFTRDSGCEESIEVSRLGGNNVFFNLSQNIFWMRPVKGKNSFESNPMYEQLGVGTDGSPDERRKLHNEIRIALGEPAVQVELSKEQIDDAIDNGLLMLRKYSGWAYERVFFFLDVFPNQQTYHMTNECVGFNTIADINGIYRSSQGLSRGSSVGGGDGSNGVFGFSALQHLYSYQTFDILSYHLVQQYLEELEFLFARHIMFQWIEDKRLLRLHQYISAEERLLIDAHIEKPEQEIITNRETRYWLKRWAIAESKMMLSSIRGKFQTLPGPNGSTTLNAQELITQSENEKSLLEAELYDPAMQNPVDTGMRSQFLIG